MKPTDQGKNQSKCLLFLKTTTKVLYLRPNTLPPELKLAIHEDAILHMEEKN